MSDETQSEYFAYTEELVDEMYEIFTQHQALENKYSAAMEYIQKMGWASDWAAYVQKMVGDDSVGDSSD